MSNFELEQSPTYKKLVALESDSLAEVLMALQAHKDVAWIRRQNTGAAKVGNRFVKFGWKGCSDLLGQLKDGRFLAIECKRKGGKLSSEQEHFLSMVNQFNGVAFVATSYKDVFEKLRRSNG